LGPPDPCRRRSFQMWNDGVQRDFLSAHAESGMTESSPDSSTLIPHLGSSGNFGTEGYHDRTALPRDAHSKFWNARGSRECARSSRMLLVGFASLRAIRGLRALPAADARRTRRPQESPDSLDANGANGSECDAGSRLHRFTFPKFPEEPKIGMSDRPAPHSVVRPYQFHPLAPIVAGAAGQPPNPPSSRAREPSAAVEGTAALLQ
jgi:hypothetical protein